MTCIQKIKKELAYVVEVFSFLLRRKSNELAEHALRVSDYAGAIAARMGLSHTEINTIQAAGILHDIGLLNLPYMVLQKRPFLQQENVHYTVVIRSWVRLCWN